MTTGASPWPRAAVFDCDGVLVDSAGCWEAAYAEVAQSLGRSLFDVDISALAGASVADAALQLSRDLGAPVSRPFVRAALHRSFTASPPRPLPGARALASALADRMPLAVASNAPREILETVLTATGLAGHFTAVVSAEETAADKPAPDVYVEACRRLGVDPSDAVAFEDSPRGADAARGAGLVLVGVLPSRNGIRLDADLVVSSLRDKRLESFLGVWRRGSRDCA